MKSGWAVGLLLLLFAAPAAGETKRVLIVHSFGTGAPPFTTHSTAFAATLAKEMGEPIDLDEISLGMARYPQPDLEEAYVKFLAKRLQKWQPDLVAPVGSPAGRFVAKHRIRLFPRTPIVYTGMDRRTLPPGTLTDNATFVGESFDLPGLVEDILQLQPDTKHVAVVVGATPLERFWAKVFQEEFARFSDRVTFTWFNDLSFDQMLDRAASMPPRSFILVGLLLRDAKGVTYNQDDAIVRLHAVANAPINGMYRNQIGLGIVGGRLYQGRWRAWRRRASPFESCGARGPRASRPASSTPRSRGMTGASSSAGTSARLGYLPAAWWNSARPACGGNTSGGSSASWSSALSRRV
jgi:hypothetical protein